MFVEFNDLYTQYNMPEVTVKPKSNETIAKYNIPRILELMTYGASQP